MEPAQQQGYMILASRFRGWHFHGHRRGSIGARRAAIGESRREAEERRRSSGEQQAPTREPANSRPQQTACACSCSAEGCPSTRHRVEKALATIGATGTAFAFSLRASVCCVLFVLCRLASVQNRDWHGFCRPMAGAGRLLVGPHKRLRIPRTRCNRKRS